MEQTGIPQSVGKAVSCVNEMQVFTNSEFGEIRTVTIDGNPWFVGIEVAKALGYAIPKTAPSKHVDREDMLSTQIRYQGQMRDMTVINESGLYSLIFGSKLESAKKFKKWVTSEVLPQIRKTGTYGREQLPMTTDGKIALLAQGHMEIKQEVRVLRNDLDELKMSLPILPVEADAITESVRKRGIEILGGKNTPAYRDKSLRRRLYCNLYSNLKYQFNVRTYKSIKRCQCEKAVEIIRSYQPPFFLEQMIDERNK